MWPRWANGCWWWTWTRRETQPPPTGCPKINWTATITVDTSFAEELLDDVKFSDYTSSTGKVGEEYTTTTDNKYVTYDKTLPTLEYINK